VSVADHDINENNFKCELEKGLFSMVHVAQLLQVSMVLPSLHHGKVSIIPKSLLHHGKVKSHTINSINSFWDRSHKQTTDSEIFFCFIVHWLHYLNLKIIPPPLADWQLLCKNPNTHSNLFG
jgi:hypothetical protein